MSMGFDTLFYLRKFVESFQIWFEYFEGIRRGIIKNPLPPRI